MNIKQLPHIQKKEEHASVDKLLKYIKNDIYNDFRRKKLAVPTRSCIDFIDLDKIYYLKAESNYCKIFIEGSKNILASKPLKHFAEALSQGPFIRVHSGYLVNLSKIISISRKGEVQIVIEGGYKIPISRKYKDYIYERLIGQ